MNKFLTDKCPVCFGQLECIDGGYGCPNWDMLPHFWAHTNDEVHISLPNEDPFLFIYIEDKKYYFELCISGMSDPILIDQGFKSYDDCIEYLTAIKLME